MAMIPYPELVAALHSWRARKGLETGPAHYLSTTATGAAGVPAMPVPARPAAAPAWSAAPAAAPAWSAAPAAAPGPAYGGPPAEYGAAALGGVASAYGADDDGEYDDGDLDIVAEEDEQGEAAGVIDRAATDAQTVDDEATAMGGYELDYGQDDSGTVDVGDGEVVDEEIEHGELDRSPPPLAPPDDDDGDGNPWK